ncbi:vesicle-fusing ATPase, partial [Enteropsectra breve]
MYGISNKGAFIWHCTAALCSMAAHPAKAFLKTQKPSAEQSKINAVFVNPSHFIDSKRYAILNSKFLFAVDSSSDIPSNSLTLSKIQREFVKIDHEETMTAEFLEQGYFQTIDILCLKIELLPRSLVQFGRAILGKVTLDASTLISVIKTKYEQFPFNSGQRLTIEISPEDVGETCTGLKRPCNFILTVNALVADGSRAPYGILTEMTDVSVESASSDIEITNSHGIRKSLSFEELGIGGLKKEFEQMFRRAFVQRLFDSEFVSKFGVSNVKGIMLYGPPGTGKTLIARKLGSLLNARPPQIVNGPEILNRYVGQSEENIRRLFAAAEEEYKLKGEKSQLHIIIFDEIDAICKKRGSSGGAGVGDQVVNQLLSKIDGVEALNNILVIGMTNRLDLIDEALLRPGRFEIHLEISLPDEEARREIFAIHTKTMAKN